MKGAQVVSPSLQVFKSSSRTWVRGEWGGGWMVGLDDPEVPFQPQQSHDSVTSARFFHVPHPAWLRPAELEFCSWNEWRSLQCPELGAGHCFGISWGIPVPSPYGAEALVV